MERLQKAEINFRVPDEVLANDVGADRGRQRDAQAAIHDGAGVYIATSLTEAAAAMRKLGCFSTGVASGIIWSEVPDGAAAADAVRAQVRRNRN